MVSLLTPAMRQSCENDQPLPLRFVLLYVLLLGVLGVLFLRLPTSFLPDEDQGTLYAQITLPVGATQERALDVIAQVENYFLDHEKDAVRSVRRFLLEAGIGP